MTMKCEFVFFLSDYREDAHYGISLSTQLC